MSVNTRREHRKDAAPIYQDDQAKGGDKCA